MQSIFGLFGWFRKQNLRNRGKSQKLKKSKATKDSAQLGSTIYWSRGGLHPGPALTLLSLAVIIASLFSSETRTQVL